MANFEKAYLKTSGHEGGYVNDETDKGGETYCGISRKYHPNWDGWEYIDQVKRTRAIQTNEKFDNETLKAQVKILFKKLYWDVVNLDNLGFQDVAEEIYDTGVNMGVVRAVVFLQESLNIINKNQKLYADLDIDGKFGPATMEALDRCNKKALLKALNGFQFMTYYKIMQADPEQEKFAIGWLYRT